MSRTKAGTPRKQKLTLTVSSTGRTNLECISKYYGRSISTLVEECAEKQTQEIKRIDEKFLRD